MAATGMMIPRLSPRSWLDFLERQEKAREAKKVKKLDKLTSAQEKTQDQSTQTISWVEKAMGVDDRISAQVKSVQAIPTLDTKPEEFSTAPKL